MESKETPMDDQINDWPSEDRDRKPLGPLGKVSDDELWERARMNLDDQCVEEDVVQLSQGREVERSGDDLAYVKAWVVVEADR